VLALDNSPEMLAQAATRVAAAGLANVELMLGDTRHPRLDGLAADCIVVNMVLHHTAAPPQILADLARALSPTGTLLVTDLCRHDQAWAQSSCGDLWLGFEPGELRQWAAAAGLYSIGSELLAQRNGFQIQIHLFRHAP
jgi:ArsR family transcriptional regulator